jgi:hypothetical protein
VTIYLHICSFVRVHNVDDEKQNVGALKLHTLEVRTKTTTNPLNMDWVLDAGLVAYMA